MKRSYRVEIGLCVVAVMSLAGCSANHHSIYRSKTLSMAAPSATFVDAKQRAVIARPVEVTTTTTTTVAEGETVSTTSFERGAIVCAEPSPDVFTVLAQSLSGTGSFGKSADPKSVQVAASLAYSSAEQGSSLARTQTINMLRESMFRTCERYFNGSLTQLEMPIQAVRDQRMMVATLAIEQLTAAATPRAVSIGASGSAAAGVSAEESVVRLDDAHKALSKADAAQTEKQAAYDKIKDVTPTCEAVKKKADAKETLTAEETAKQTDCAKAAGELATAKAARQDASAHYETLKTAATTGGGGPASASTTVQKAADIEAAATSAAALEKVAATVEAIVRANYEQDEFLMLCLKVFGGATASEVTLTCKDYVNAKIDAETSKSKVEKAENDRKLKMLGALEDADAEQFARFWTKISPDGAVIDPARLAAVIDAFIETHSDHPNKEKLQRMKTSKDRAALYQTFKTLTDDARSSLAN